MAEGNCSQCSLAIESTDKSHDTFCVIIFPSTVAGFIMETNEQREALRMQSR